MSIPLVTSDAPSGDAMQLLAELENNVASVFLGKPEIIRLSVVALLAEGHLLIEDVPGIGKTLLAKALARSLGCSFHRIQFTPDLLPSDLLGTSVFHQGAGSFVFQPGPLFAQVVLADEINRATPRTQSALLEAMSDRQVSSDGQTRPLGPPFFVLATQNPYEFEGTYPLPESQLDRFLMRIRMGYPDRAAELTMLESERADSVDDLPVVAPAGTVPAMVVAARQVHTAPALRGYVVDLAAATRKHPALQLGMSPRSTLALQSAARALAASEGRDYVIPDDVKALFAPVAEHRLMLSAEALISGVELPEVLNDIVGSVAVPSARSGG